MLWKCDYVKALHASYGALFVLFLSIWNVIAPGTFYFLFIEKSWLDILLFSTK